MIPSGFAFFFVLGKNKISVCILSCMRTIIVVVAAAAAASAVVVGGFCFSSFVHSSQISFHYIANVCTLFLKRQCSQWFAVIVFFLSARLLSLSLVLFLPFFLCVFSDNHFTGFSSNLYVCVSAS